MSNVQFQMKRISQDIYILINLTLTQAKIFIQNKKIQQLILNVVMNLKNIMNLMIF